MVNSSNSSKGGLDGNTKSKQVSPSKHWCFTLNNWNDKEKDMILDICSNGSKSYVFQAEVGSEGTPHLQGYIELKTKDRPKGLFGIDRIHWEVCRNPKASILYCCKSDTSTGERWTNIKLPKPLKIITDLYEWQEDIVKIIDVDPDDRSIYWFYESVGGIGKTQFCKYLCSKYNALILSGKGSDCKFAIIKYEEKYGYYPEIIVFDIPRCMNDYVNYDCLESVKNGLFFSNKYESAQVIMNSPHILCFSNQMPDTGQMSKDRWIIKLL